MFEWRSESERLNNTDTDDTNLDPNGERNRD